jgi:hypothetical protein
MSDFLIPPPPLLSKIERGRAGRSEGEVYKTQVVCRSAPGSRSGSVDAKERRNYERGRGNKRKKNTEHDRLPSLARTQAEGDVWSRTTSKKRGARMSNANRYLGGWGADSESEENDGGGGHVGASSEEEDDEGELDLARILVPPKRQKSIKSLRKHLVSADSATAGGSRAQATLKNIAGVIIPGARTSMGGSKPSATSQRRRAVDDWGGQGNAQEEWGAGWVRKARASDDDDVESFNGFFGEGRTELVGTGRSGTGKSRLGFNSAWGLAGGAAS